MKFRFTTFLSVSLTTLALSQTVHADATLDRIKARGTLTVGVVLDGTSVRSIRRLASLSVTTSNLRKISPGGLA